jgi:hypothetical protein
MAKNSQSSSRSPRSSSHARPSGKGRSTRTGDAPARGHVDSPETSAPKVGSDDKAAAHFGERNDFGIPATKAQPGQQTVIDGSLDDRPLGTRMPPADPDGRRDVGVGAPNSGPGSFSGGDLDPDIVGVGTGTGVAASPERHTDGPDIIESASDMTKDFGPPAKGENELPPGTHGTIGHLKGTVHDRMPEAPDDHQAATGSD